MSPHRFECSRVLGEVHAVYVRTADWTLMYNANKYRKTQSFKFETHTWIQFLLWLWAFWLTCFPQPCYLHRVQTIIIVLFTKCLGMFFTVAKDHVQVFRGCDCDRIHNLMLVISHSTIVCLVQQLAPVFAGQTEMFCGRILAAGKLCRGLYPLSAIYCSVFVGESGQPFHHLPPEKNIKSISNNKTSKRENLNFRKSR